MRVYAHGAGARRAAHAHVLIGHLRACVNAATVQTHKLVWWRRGVRGGEVEVEGEGGGGEGQSRNS